MTNIGVIESKASFIRKTLKLLRVYKKCSRQQIEEDPTLSGAVRHYLYVAVQATIDLAEAMIAFKQYRKPSIYSEAFDILAEENFITADLCENLRKMCGFRNVVAHAYDKIDSDTVYDILQNRLKDLESFLKAIGRKIGI